jgi:ATP-dependent DNA helicase RecG
VPATRPRRGARARESVTARELQDVPVEEVKGVGLTAGEALRGRGIATAGDLLARLPRRYLDLRNADDWGLVRTRAVGALLALTGDVVDARGLGPAGRRGLSIALREPRGTTTLRAVFFHAPPGLRQRAQAGGTVRVVGVLRANGPELELVQPRLLTPGARTRPIEAVYAGIGAIPPGNVARIVAAAARHADEWGDPVPDAIAAGLRLPSSAAALRAIHLPSAQLTPDELALLARGESAAHRRLAFEELLVMQVALERLRREGGRARAIARDLSVADAAGGRLELELTGGQRAAVATLINDLASACPARRLLAADVGAGKTAVAAAASLAVVRAGGSVAWLAPTTLVAEQHGRTLSRALGGEAGPVAILLGSTPRRAREDAQRAIAAGQVRAVVGTHAILAEGATPPGLALAVVDEQHRFGVAQRLALVAGRSPVPHLLVLSATPIPRTLALARYGDMDLLDMKEKPPGRQPVTTRLLPAEDRAFVLHTIERALAAGAGGRVFVVVPRIEPDEACRVALHETDAWLATHLGRERVAVVHGRMRAREQHEALVAFRQGTHPVLLGTSVVEVGLDVPQANLMVVLGAEHFGVAQLHQLRGRVGRAGQRAACLLVPERLSDEARARLLEVAASDDGFALAERDLARRGGGEWFGARQSGRDATLRFADPLAAPALLLAAQQTARELLADDPALARHPALARAVARLLARGAEPTGEEA